MDSAAELPRTAGASVIFCNSAEQVLLFLRDDRNDIPFPNCWDLPGGHVETGETPLECIQREMREELEFELKDPQLFRTYDMEDRVEYTFWKRADFDIHTLPLHEGQGLKWFSQAEIQAAKEAQIAFGFRGVLLEFYGERPWQG